MAIVLSAIGGAIGGSVIGGIGAYFLLRRAFKDMM